MMSCVCESVLGTLGIVNQNSNFSYEFREILCGVQEFVGVIITQVRQIAVWKD